MKCRTNAKLIPFLPFSARFAVIALSIAVLAGMAQTASAKIRCSGPYQIIKGTGQHVTPYCEDNYLAAIARNYGWKVSNRSVRYNPGLKARICRHIGHDARLIGICDEHRPGRNGGRRL